MRTNVRIGNDIKLLWEVLRGGQPVNLNEATYMAVSIMQGGVLDCNAATPITTFAVDTTQNNLLVVEIQEDKITELGYLWVKLEYTMSDGGMIDGNRKITIDNLPVKIVGLTDEAGDVYEFNVTTDVVVGFDGKSAYEVWLVENPDKTLQDYFDWLQQPATDAAASLSTLEQTVSDNEGLRVTAEKGRNDAEGLRVAAESARNDAEGIRDSNEIDRINAESDRVDAEDLRDQAEVAREEAEEARANAEEARANAEGDREDAEDLRDQAEGLRELAEIARANAEGDETKGRVKAENDRVAAEILRNETFDQMMDEADDKIGEMDATLSTYEGRMSQAESDITQLAGEVSLLDAVQGAKIKDIENVLSTANLNQSAQVSVSGVSPLSLPKNAANGGMSVKLEGLTEDVEGVITHFEPTGRVRSVGENLFNKNDIIPNKIVLVNGGLTNSSIANVSNYIRIQGGLSYYISGRTESSYIAFYDINYIFISSIAGRNITLSAPSSAVFVRFSVSYADMNTCKFERGAIATAYDQYRETSLYITSPELRSNGTVKDEIRKGANGYELVKRISDVDGSVLTTPEIIPISYGGVLNSAENGTVYHEPIIADAGVYDTKMDILLTDYPITSIEEIIKHENGVDTYLNAATAVIASDGLSFTHPDLADGDLVLFTYLFDKESTSGNITATFYDSNVVKIDTVTGKAYRINEVVTNGVLTRTLTEV